MSNHQRQIVLFFAGAALLAMASTIFDTTFNNYVRHAFQKGAGERGLLELPREFPGLAVTLVAGALLFLPEVRVASVAAGAAAVGMLGLALWSRTYGAMIGWMVLFSTGVHLMMPMEGAIAVGLARPERRGRRLGQVAMATTAAGLVACFLVWLVLRRDPNRFGATFLIGVVLAAAGAAVFLFMRPHVAHNPRRPRLVLRRRYWLFYVLQGLYGARKQVFLTFGPWVIITVFDRPASTIALLVLIGRGLGVVFKPLLGRLIDRVGPRAVLVGEALALMAVCLGYGFARGLPTRSMALGVIYVCFVLDDLLFAASMARTVYVVRLAPGQEEVVGTLAAGVSINHVVSMVAPAFGGMLWVAAGRPEPVFLVAAGIMVVTLIFAAQARTPAPEAAAAAPAPAAAVPDAAIGV